MDILSEQFKNNLKIAQKRPRRLHSFQEIKKIKGLLSF